MFRKMYSFQGLILTFQWKRSSNECLPNGPNSTRTPHFSIAKWHAGVCLLDLLTLGPIGDFFYALWLCWKNENMARRTSLLSSVRLFLKDFLTCLAGYSLVLFFFWKVRWLFLQMVHKLGQPAGPAPCVRNVLRSSSLHLEIQDPIGHDLTSPGAQEGNRSHLCLVCPFQDSHERTRSRSPELWHGQWAVHWLAPLSVTGFPFFFLSVDLPLTEPANQKCTPETWVSQVHAYNGGLSRATLSHRALWMVLEIRNISLIYFLRGTRALGVGDEEWLLMDMRASF